MPAAISRSRGLLHLVICAASPVRHIDSLMALLRDSGWKVTVIATPTAVTWIDAKAVRQLSGGRLYSTIADLDGATLTEPELVLVAPATFNTINQWTAGINNTLALAVLHEALGNGTRTLVAPHVNRALAVNPIYRRSLDLLVTFGVQIVDQDSPCEGGCDGSQHWAEVIEALRA